MIISFNIEVYMEKILILGGYGGVGKSISENLRKHTDVEISIAGRNFEKSDNYAKTLKEKFSDRKIFSVYADASQKESLIKAFKDIDLVIVTTTTPDHIATIAEAAIETESDMIDILVRGDVVDTLESYRSTIIEKGRIFITQAGFHPGLPAPFIKYGRDHFDKLNSASVVMAMNAIFEKPESTHEIIHGIGENNAKLLKDGAWKKATYQDALKIKFSDNFGIRQCFPLQMREIYPLQKELDISNLGVYSSGFNAFVDNFVFPLIILLQHIKKGLGTKVCGKLMHWGIKKYNNNKPGVEFRLMANGIINGIEKKYTLEANSNDAFEFTSLAVIACIKQYLDNTINSPNLYLMGNIVDYIRIINDLKNMGILIKDAYQDI
jgi:hypothetical protein